MKLQEVFVVLSKAMCPPSLPCVFVPESVPMKLQTQKKPNKETGIKTHCTCIKSKSDHPSSGR